MGIKIRDRKLASGKISIYLDFHFNGRRWTETTGIVVHPKDRNKKETRHFLDEIILKHNTELISNEYGIIPAYKRKANFIDFCDKYVSSYKGKDIRKIIGTVQKFKDFIEKRSLSMSQLSHIQCTDFMEYLKSDDSGLSGETPYNYWGRFKAIVNRAYKEGFLIKNPIEGIRFVGRKDSKETLTKEVLTIDELRTLSKTKCSNNEVKRAFLFSAFTGLGYAEIIDLKGQNVKNGVIKYQRKKSKSFVSFPLHTSAVQQLNGHYEDDDFLFRLPSDTAVNKNLKTWMSKAKINKHITFYCARHSFATNILLQKTGSVKDVMDVMGHSSLQHTIKYVKHTNESRDKAVNELEGL